MRVMRAIAAGSGTAGMRRWRPRSIDARSIPNRGVALNRSFYRGGMLPLLYACAPGVLVCADARAVEIGPPLWMLATAMVGIFVLLIGAAVAVGAVYRRNH